ncbi:MAG: metallophosphoesterase, partial [Pseudomonadota bacterium]
MLNKSFLVKCIRTVFISIFLLLVFVPPKAEAVRFIVAGDSRGGPGTGYPFLNTTILGEIAQATLAENADFILLPGDLVWGYPTLTYPLIDQLAAWRTTMQPVYDAGIGVFPCRGNHDAANDSPARTAWNTVFSGEYALPDNGPAG